MQRLTTPAGLSRRFGLRPFSARAVLLCGNVPRHGGGVRNLVKIRDFADALSPRTGENPLPSAFEMRGPTGLYSGGSSDKRSVMVGHHSAPFYVRKSTTE